jgi:glycosyltransferase involved in cell wall biosynthesis
VAERILHYVDFALPKERGYSLRTAAIAAAQQRQGHEVAVAVRARRHTWRVWLPAQAQHGGVLHLHPPGRMTKMFRRDQVPLDRYARWIERVWGRPTILFGHTPGGLADEQEWMARHFGAKFVYQVRGFWKGRTDPEVAAALRADEAQAICEGVRGVLVEHGLPRASVSLMPNGVELDRFPPANRPDRAAPHFGYATHVRELEGVQVIAEAWPRVREAIPGAEFHLFGSGEHLKAVQELASDGFICHGAVPHDQIAGRIALLDVLVVPRISTPVTEAVTPLKPLEAMAASVCVLASDVGGLRELVRHNETGYLFRAGESEDAARACVELGKDPALRHRLEQGARRWVETERTWDVVVGLA